MEKVLRVISKEQLEKILQLYKENKIEGFNAFRKALTPSFSDLLKGVKTPFENYSLREFKTLLDEIANQE